ncbi:MAG: cytochrome c [Pseudohongiellaceae bacterium]
MLKRILTASTALLACAAIFTATAQDGPSPQQQAIAATETRQAVFKLLGFHMGPIGAMARGDREFDAELAERNARRIAELAPMIPDVVAAMDTRDFDVETEALPRIWDNMDAFEQAAADLEEGANQFAETAAGGDRMEVIGAVRAFGSNCGNCHDDFRVDDD